MTDTYRDHFKAHVVPMLRTLSTLWGQNVAAGIFSYEEAFDSLCGVANNLGSYNLPDADHEKLLDWIGNRLSDEITRSEQQGWSGYAQWLDAITQPAPWLDAS